ncbi:hypothetical protein GCM10022293_32000 [Azospirillum formosense]
MAAGAAADVHIDLDVAQVKHACHGRSIRSGVPKPSGFAGRAMRRAAAIGDLFGMPTRKAA